MGKKKKTSKDTYTAHVAVSSEAPRNKQNESFPPLCSITRSLYRGKYSLSVENKTEVKVGGSEWAPVGMPRKVYVRVEETGNRRGRETNDRKMQPERNDTDERAKTKKDERLLRSPRHAGGVTIQPTGQKSPRRMFVKYRVFHE